MRSTTSIKSAAGVDDRSGRWTIHNWTKYTTGMNGSTHRQWQYACADSATVCINDLAGHGLMFSTDPDLDDGQYKVCKHLF